jgi:hypothetical protein
MYPPVRYGQSGGATLYLEVPPRFVGDFRDFVDHYIVSVSDNNQDGFCMALQFAMRDACQWPVGINHRGESYLMRDVVYVLSITIAEFTTINEVMQFITDGLDKLYEAANKEASAS